MKKYIISLVTILFLLNILACGGSNGNKDTDNKFEMKKAESLVDIYMKNLIKGDVEAIKKVLTDQLSNDAENVTKSALNVKGYSMDESYQVGDTGIFKVKVASTAANISRTTLDTYTIKVIVENWNYKISQINVAYEKESYFENYGLRLRKDNSVKTDLLIDSDGIPQYGYSKEDKANINKIEIPRTDFGNIIFGYSGDSIAISTRNNSITFLGIVKISNGSVSTASGSQGGAGGGTAQGGAAQGGAASGAQGESNPSQGTGPREIPLGKEISSLDVLTNSKVDFMVFSPDEKLLLVQYTNNDMKGIKVYISENGELIPFKFEENFNINNVDIVFSNFDKDNLYFEVIPKESKKNIEKSTAGTWQMDLKKFKVKKV